MNSIEESAATTTVMSQIEAAALPLEQPSDLDPLIDYIGDKQVVLLGEASHGTHEYQAMRTHLTRRLVTECGNFALVAVEADQPDCEMIDRSIRRMDNAPIDLGVALAEQQHWPSWMLSNAETVELCRWLRDYNGNLPEEQRISWKGLDRYPLWGMTRYVLDYLRDRLPPDQVNAALDAPLRGEAMIPEKDIDVVAGHAAMALTTADSAGDAGLYYGKELRGGIKAMNARSNHWLETLDKLLDQHGPQARAILWAHNTHVGDSRGSSMGTDGFRSIGQLVRERYGPENIALIGTGGGDGTVMAARERGAAMDTIGVPEPSSGSIEALLSQATGDEAALFVFPEKRTGWLMTELAHRAIGAVYYPDRDGLFYVPTRLGLRYDVLCWYPHTTPVQALHLEAARRGELETLRV